MLITAVLAGALVCAVAGAGHIGRGWRKVWHSTKCAVVHCVDAPAKAPQNPAGKK